MTSDELYDVCKAIDDTGEFRVSFPIRSIMLLGHHLPPEVRKVLADAVKAQYAVKFVEEGKKR